MTARVNFPLNQPKKILLTNKTFNKESNFFKNGSVDIFDSNNLLIAKGISKISSKEFSLGKEAESKVVIHKDNLLIL